MEKKSAETGTQSLNRALDLLRIVASRSRTGLRLVEAVEQTGLTRPTVHRLLQALTHQGFTAYDPASRRYHLGPEAF
ncbi:MAG TPA: helix-turn-helix domain-containing protein, partial [Acidiphilium sp.]